MAYRGTGRKGGVRGLGVFARASKLPSLSPRDPGYWLRTFGEYDETSNRNVGIDDVRGLPAVYACVMVLVRTISTLPIKVFRYVGAGTEQDRDHQLFSLLHSKPNKEQTPSEFFSCVVGSLELRGNAYAQILRDRGSRVVELIPLRSDRMLVDRLEGELVYKYDNRVFSMSDIIHWRGPATDDGIVGLSPLSVARKTWGRMLATEEHQGRTMGRGARFPGYLKFPGALKPDARENLRDSFKRIHGGPENLDNVPVLEEGMDWVQAGMSMEDAQFVELSRLNIGDAARIFGIQLHKVAEMERSTMANIEQQAIEFWTDTIRPRVESIEQRLELSLLTDRERSTHFIEFNADAILRGDTKARWEAYRIGMGSSILTANEVRRRENFNPVEGGDERLIPVNMLPWSMLSSGAQEPRNSPPTTTEKRSSPVERFRLRAAFYPVFSDAGSRIIRREVNDVRRGLKGKDAKVADAWLEQFYAPEGDFARYVKTATLPVYSAYAQALESHAREQAGDDAVFDADVFADEYAGALAFRHVLSHRNQLQQLLVPPQEREDYDYEAETEQRLDEWDEKWPGKFASRESVGAGEGFMKYAWGAAGIAGSIWTLSGDENCPLCERLAGKRVGMKESFLLAGQGLEAVGVSTFMSRSNVTHPPLHAGCDCYLRPGL